MNTATQQTRDLERTLISRRRIARRVREMANELDERYREGELTLVCILTGAIVFVSDLMREMSSRMRIGVVMVSTYRGATTRSGKAQIKIPLDKKYVTGKHVLVVDDILDSGKTLQVVAEILRPYRPASLRTCVFLRKRRPEALECPVDMVGFDIPDRWVVGYGLDYNDTYRNLPHVAILSPQVYGG